MELYISKNEIVHILDEGAHVFGFDYTYCGNKVGWDWQFCIGEDWHPTCKTCVRTYKVYASSKGEMKCGFSGCSKEAAGSIEVVIPFSCLDNPLPLAVCQIHLDR